VNSLSFLNENLTGFPAPEYALADPNGLLAIGGDLHPERLLNAYYQGIFPWFNADDPICWWSPDPRAVFIPGQLKLSRSLAKFIRKQPWKITVNTAFADVMAGCAQPRAKQDGTWITAEIRLAYQELHAQGHAHSVEVWQDDRLIGGLYGLAIGQVFCGESMFHRQTNASKVAMLALDSHLLRHGFKLIDAQVMNPHLASLGARPVRRSDFLSLLRQYREVSINANCWQVKEVLLEV
jgi:leucyl/phenylalanyl-tRNA---protein transferase